MGCSSSRQTEPSGGDRRVFRVTDLNGRDDKSCSKKLEVTHQDLILHQKGKGLIRWPLWCLRRYGCDRDLLIFESGRRCPTGPGTFAFRCRQAEALFNLLHHSVVCNSQPHNSQLPIANNRLNPSMQSVVLCELFQEIPATENTITTNGTKPIYVNDPGRLKYYNVWCDNVCRTVDYADLNFSLIDKEEDVFTEPESIIMSHSYVNIGSKEQLQPSPYVNVPVNTNSRACVNVPVKIQKPFPVQHQKSFRDCDDSGYLNPQRAMV